MNKAIVLVVCLALIGCRSDRLIGRSDLKIVEGTALPAPTRQDLILQQRSYLIGPFDKVTIEVYGLPELSRTLSVDASGTVALPLAGVIEASGKTPTELAAIVADRLRGRYVKDPHVTVNADTVNQSFTVDGAVAAPGLYPVNGRMTLIRAVATAKGLTEFARSNYIVVFRQVGNQQMAALYDLRAIRQGMYADPEVYANDLILVGESGGQRSFTKILQAGALLSAPLLAIVQRF